jgi:hypothetical protein
VSWKETIRKPTVVRNNAEGGGKQRPEVEAVPALEGREDEDELERNLEGEGRADDHDDRARVKVARMWS